jgi:TrmH family RNA methyltransferase
MPISRADIKRVTALHDAKGRAEQGLMLLEGPRLVAEGLKAGAVERIFAAEDWDAAAGLGPLPAGVDVERVSASDLERMLEVRTPAGVAAVARLNRPKPAAELLGAASRLLYLDAVQDPGNAGTLARTAWALGVEALLLSPGTADPAAPKVLRASAGTLIAMPYARDIAPEAFLELAAGSGHRVVVADSHEGADYREIDPGPRWVLVASNEGAGTRLPLRDPRTTAVRIPLERGAESLNVAAAVAILLAAFRSAR